MADPIIAGLLSGLSRLFIDLGKKRVAAELSESDWRRYAESAAGWVIEQCRADVRFDSVEWHATAALLGSEAVRQELTNTLSLRSVDLDSLINEHVPEQWHGADRHVVQTQLKRLFELLLAFDDDGLPRDLRAALRLLQASLEEQFDETRELLRGVRDTVLEIADSSPTRHEAEADAWLGRPTPLGDFIPRGDLIERVKKLLQNEGVAVLAGGAGTGKTRLAYEVARSDSAIGGFWTTAGDSVEATVAAFARDVGANAPGVEDVFAARRFLSRQAPGTIWVIDNIRPIAAAKQLVDISGPVSMLCTTRDTRAYQLGNEELMVLVGEMSEPEAIALMKSRGYSGDEAPLAEIADEVGYLPMALELIGVDLARPGRDPRVVLEEVRSGATPEEVEAFQDRAGEWASIPRPDGVYTVLRGVLDRLPTEVRASISPLGYIAADRPVPLDLFAALCGLDRGATVAAIDSCREESVLTVGSRGGVQTLLLHSLTGAAIAATNADEGEVLASAWGAVRARMEILTHGSISSLDRELDHYSAILDSLASPRLLGPEHSVTAAARNALGVAHLDAGRIHEAIALHEETLDFRLHTLGAEHPDTLDSHTNLALAWWVAGRTDAAIQLHEEVLELRKKVLGPEHADTLHSRNNLALAYATAGRTDEALALHEETLDLRVRTLGAEHPDSLASRANLANAYVRAGRTDEALPLHEETLELATRLLGTEHPDTLKGRANLALTYGAAGRNDEAIALHEETLDLMVAVFGPEHPNTLGSRGNLANSYAEAGRVGDAIALHEETLDLTLRLLGPEHPDTLASRSNLAIVYRFAGMHADAERLEARDGQDSD